MTPESRVCVQCRAMLTDNASGYCDECCKPKNPAGLNLPEGWLLPAIQAAINAPPPPKKKIYALRHFELYSEILSYHATKAGAFKAMMRSKNAAWYWEREKRWVDPADYLAHEQWWIAEYDLND